MFELRLALSLVILEMVSFKLLFIQWNASDLLTRVLN